MKTNKFITLIVMVFSIAIGFCITSLSNYYVDLNQLNKPLSYDESRNYYMLDHSTNEERNISIRMNRYHFQSSDYIDQKINQVFGISTYNYNALYLYSNSLTEEISTFNFSIDSQDYHLINLSDCIMLLPYYPEDNLENDKIYISTKLYDKLEERGIDILNKTITLSSVEVPIGQFKDQIDSIKNGVTTKVDCNAVAYTYVPLELTIDDIIDYQSRLYDTNQVILIPYQMLEDLIAQNASSNYDPYLAPIHTYFPKEDNNDQIVHYILDIDDCINISSPMQQRSQAIEKYIVYNKDFIKGIIISTIICLIILVIITRYTIFDIQELFFFYITICICSIIVSIIKNKTFSFQLFEWIVGYLLIALALSLLIRKKGKLLFTGTYEQCIQYIKEQKIEHYEIVKKTSKLQRYITMITYTPAGFKEAGDHATNQDLFNEYNVYQKI